MTSDGPPLSVSALPGYEAQPHESGVDHSRAKLENVKLSCVVTRRLPCTKSQETQSYRCTCTFQLVRTLDHKLHYAMRSQQRPILLGSDVFCIANGRIQAAMKGLLRSLYSKGGRSDVVDARSTHLTSVSFASSWNEVDCVITLHYEAPFNVEAWKIQAKDLFLQLNLLCVVGRSKGVVVSVGSEKKTLSDSVWISRVSDEFVASLDRHDDAICVLYEKPVTAFFHPNARVMLQALEWILSRLRTVTESIGSCNMLEMYCGFGAHTVAVACTGLLETIVAVELDQRLVDACVANCKRNDCLGHDGMDHHRTPVYVVKGDATEWAVKSRRLRSQGLPCQNSELLFLRYKVLLVDPPRMGLDPAVCEMAMEGTFEHILYISCGRNALQRDLDIFKKCFEVVDCTLLDLFPRTDAVESLVHLKRRTVLVE